MSTSISASTLVLLGGQAIAEPQNGLAFGEFPNERRRMESLPRRSCLTDLRPCPVPLLVGISIRPEGGRSKTGRQMLLGEACGTPVDWPVGKQQRLHRP